MEILRWLLVGIGLPVGLVMLAGWRIAARGVRDNLAKAVRDGPVPDTYAGKRQLLERIAARLSTPEEIAQEVAEIGESTGSQRNLAEALHGLTSEEKGWLALADRISRTSGPLPLQSTPFLLLFCGVAVTAAGVTCVFTTSPIIIVCGFGFFGLMAVIYMYIGRTLSNPASTFFGDIAVARVLDEPYQFVKVLRRMEDVQGLEKGMADYNTARRQALEAALAR